MPRNVTFGRLDRRRHIGFLGFAIASSVLTSRSRASLAPPVLFALYGALHALTVMAALRGRQAVWRGCAFVAAAAGASALTAALGIRGMHLAFALPGRTGPFVVLGVFGGLGAVAYAALIRAFGIRRMSARAAVAAVVACPLAEFVMLGTGIQAAIGPYLAISVAWWCAFSAVLCGVDHPSSKE